jgi:SAM-dependent methyltransferase
MNTEEYARMHALEDWYWWFVARRNAAARALRDFAPPERPLRILDAGCGTGGMLDLYRTWPDAEVVGLDFSPDALSFSRSRGHKRLLGGDLTVLPFRTGTFDVVNALDVVEHIDDDGRALAEISRVLRPGGILVATVPAYQFLWSAHDVALHHHRRYTAAQFSKVIGQSGLQVERLTYLVTTLFPVAAVARWMGKRKQGESGSAKLPVVPPFLNRALIGLHDAEFALSRMAPLPFGLTVLAIARKPVPARALMAAAEDGVPVLAAS